MSEEKLHSGYCMLFEFQKGDNAMGAERNLCDMFGDAAETVRKCQRWFNKFCLGDFSMKDEPRSGKPSYVSDEVLRGMIRNPTLTSTEGSFMLGIRQITALDYISVSQTVGGARVYPKVEKKII
ncbi:histone-lysine N-methyltransferase SETMAR [Trichonephila clavipes]|nr:histone-lysine N-methyltransferase SETMAR [Trichonephila clavipes]